MKKIMFNDKFGLTQAVLDGRKTMTRRIVSEKLLDRWTDYDDFCNSISVENIHTERQYYYEKDFFLDNSPYKVGEVLAIAQRYSDILDSLPEGFIRKSDGYVSSIISTSAGLNNKMFVKADLMPRHIEITGIKVECLQDISDEDCLKEGIIHAYTNNDGIKIYHTPHTKRGYLSTDIPQQAFEFLINKVSGKGVFQSNPYVFVYEFKLID